MNSSFLFMGSNSFLFMTVEKELVAWSLRGLGDSVTVLIISEPSICLITVLTLNNDNNLFERLFTYSLDYSIKNPKFSDHILLACITNLGNKSKEATESLSIIELLALMPITVFL